MNTVTSSDGTTIAFDRPGAGPAVVIIGAGPTDHSANAPVAQLLADRFTVVNYDRRARGQSGDTQPFSVDREYDLAAGIDAAGGSAMLYGTSLGGALALEAAARGLPVTKLAVWERPTTWTTSPAGPQPTTTTGSPPRSPPTKPSSAALVPPLQLRRARRDDLDAMRGP